MYEERRKEMVIGLILPGGDTANGIQSISIDINKKQPVNGSV